MLHYFYQDSKPTILLAINGFSSNSRCIKHTHHGYFLVKDLIEHDEIEISLPTKYGLTP